MGMNVVSLESHRISKQYEQHYKKCGNYDSSLDTVYISKNQNKLVTAKDYEKAYMILLTNQIN